MVQIGVIGCGQIGLGLARLLVADHSVCAFDIDKRRSEALKGTGIGFAEDVKELVSQSDVIIIAVRPQDFSSLAKSLARFLHRGHLIISTLTGITSSALRRELKKSRILRLVPNLALEKGRGLLAIEESESLNEEERTRISSLLRPAGDILFLAPELMEAFVALSGSGLAFVALAFQAMSDGAILVGFDAERARRLVHGVFEGALALLEGEEMTPETLRSRVSSPAGITVEGLQVLEERGVRGAIAAAVRAAYRRAEELGEACLKERA